MKKRHIALTILVIGLAGFSAQGISAQVQKSKSLSQWESLKPKLENGFSDSGDQEMLQFLRGKIVQLMESRAKLSNVDSITAQRTDLASSPEVLKIVEQNVSKVWTSRNLEPRSADIVAGWDIAKLDPKYKPFINAEYKLDSWQGLRVAEDGNSAFGVVTGTMQYIYDDRIVSDSRDQSQLNLIKENGVWLLDEAVGVFVGETN